VAQGIDKPTVSAEQGIGELHAPAGTIAEVGFRLKRHVLQDQQYLLDFMSRQELDEMLHQRLLHDRQQEFGEP